MSQDLERRERLGQLAALQEMRRVRRLAEADLILEIRLIDDDASGAEAVLNVAEERPVEEVEHDDDVVSLHRQDVRTVLDVADDRANRRREAARGLARRRDDVRVDVDTVHVEAAGGEIDRVAAVAHRDVQRDALREMVEALDEPGRGGDELMRMVLSVDAGGKRPLPPRQPAVEVVQRTVAALREEIAGGDAALALL